MFLFQKINTSNAWNFQIFEYLTQYLESHAVVSNFLFLAGSSFDIGAKVYSLRVDDTHTQCLNLATSLASIKMMKKSVADLDDSKSENLIEPLGEENQKTKKKKKPLNLNLDISQRVTISQKEELLNGPIQKYHGLYCGIRSDCENTLLNLSLTKKLGHSFELVISSHLRNVFCSEAYGSNEIYSSSKSFKMRPTVLPPEGICPSLQTFTIDEWDKNDENPFCPEIRNENGLLIPHLDVENDDPNIEDNWEEECAEEFAAHKNPEMVFITDMEPVNEPNAFPENLEYTYRSLPNIEFGIARVWAGPSHWKPKILRQFVAKTNNMQMTQKKETKKMKTVIEPIQYPDNYDEKNVTKQYNKTINNKKMTRKLASLVVNQQIPENLEIKPSVLYTLRHKKNLKVLIFLIFPYLLLHFVKIYFKIFKLF